MANFLPPDLEQEQADIGRQRAYAQMLRQQAQAPQGQMVGDRYVAPSITQYLASALSGYKANQKETSLEARQKALGEALSGRRKEFINSMPQAAPAQTMEMGDIDPSLAQYGLIETKAATAPAQRDYLNWAMKGLEVDPQLAQIGFKMAEQAQKGGSEFDTKVNYDQNGRAYVLSKTGDVKYLQGGNISQRDKLDNVNGVFVDPYTGKPKAVGPQDVNKPFMYDASGNVVPNTEYQEYSKVKAKAGAPQVNVKTDVKTGESLASQVGPIMKDSVAQAEAAVKQADAAQRVIQAIDSNKLFTGPGANVKLKSAQIFDAFGVAGRDDSEKLANTRQAIRGLAELTLQGRQQMKGQGAITESEGKLAEKAMSGDISDMTAAELKQLAAASERAARFNYQQHERKMKSVRERPEFSGVAPFYEAPQMIPEMKQQPSPAAGWSIKPVQ